jgi:eukaryotic-like serine/threonine-protein kinase
VAIAAGARFDHYCILTPLGADGVGEVWFARDRRLNREVTIKVLLGSPEAATYRFCASPGRKHRLLSSWAPL